MQGLSIGKLSKAAKVSIDTIRFYEKSGLLRQPSRRPSGFREYSQQDLHYLIFIRRARSLGFSLEEIGELLMLMPQQNATQATQIIEDKLFLIDEKVVELQHWGHALRELLHDAQRHASTTRSILDFFDDGTVEAPLQAAAHRRPPLRDSHE